MAYQDVFVKITDINGTRQSYSCRQKVNWVNVTAYFSNYANLRICNTYKPDRDEMPIVTISRQNYEGSPLTIDITGLLRTKTKLVIGDCVIDLEHMDAEKLLEGIAVSQLSVC